MATPSDLIRVAAAEVGTGTGRKYWEYFGGTYVSPSITPYCARFVSWCLIKANVTCEGFPRSVAIDRRDGFERMVEPEDLRPGDVVGFDWDYDRTGDHVGIVEDRDAVDASIITFEGNTGGGRVLRCTRRLYQCTIGVRPYFEDSTSPAKEQGLLDLDGIAGFNTISLAQEQLITPVDGVISGQRSANDRYRRNVWAVEHGTSGSPMVAELQRRVGAGVDGHWGEDTSRRLQLVLKDMGYYTGPIDCDFAHHSVVAWQRSLNDRRWVA